MDNEQPETLNNVSPVHDLRQEQRLLAGAADVLLDYGLTLKLLEVPPGDRDPHPDALVEIADGIRQVTFVVAVKPRPRTAQAGALVALLRRFQEPALLLAEYVNPELAENLRCNDICFLDLEGNAYLRGDGLMIWVTGRKDTQRIRTERETRRAFQPTGLRVIFALLCHPELVEDDYRTLAEVTGVALGTVQWVMRDLIQEGYVLRTGHTTRRLIQLDRLLDEWALGYARNLHAKLKLGHFETRNLDAWREADIAAHDAVWGGEAAAALMTGYLKPETLTLWVEQPAPRLLAALGLRQDDGGRFQLRKAFWTRKLTHRIAKAPGIAERTVDLKLTAQPVLVYAELLAIGDARTLETAARIRDEWIDRPFQRYRARADR